MINKARIEVDTMKKAVAPSILIAVMLLAVAVMAERSSRRKFPRIGFYILVPCRVGILVRTLFPFEE